MSKDNLKHVEHLLDLNSNISCMESCASFTCGFQYGALMMLEVMTGLDF